MCLFMYSLSYLVRWCNGSGLNQHSNVLGLILGPPGEFFLPLRLCISSLFIQRKVEGYVFIPPLLGRRVKSPELPL